MQTLPETNPANACVERAIKSKSRTFITNLEYLAQSFPDYTKPLETIHPFIRAPWWTPSHSIMISSNKKAAKKHHDETTHNPHTLLIYTDGSGIKDQVGAAAYCPELSKTIKQHLGPEAEFNVYAAELLAINMAVNIVKMSCGPNTPYTECVIYADS